MLTQGSSCSSEHDSSTSASASRERITPNILTPHFLMAILVPPQSSYFEGDSVLVREGVVRS